MQFSRKNFFENSKFFLAPYLKPVDLKLPLKLMEKKISYHFIQILLMRCSLTSLLMQYSFICFRWFALRLKKKKKTKKNNKEELLNALCFLNIGSVLGHEVVHIRIVLDCF